MTIQGPYSSSHERSEADPTNLSGTGWYFSKKEIEENSPSRQDGIDLKRETTFTKLYCSFLQDLGMRLKVPPVTIATSIVFCHRFFLRRSHAKNDRWTIATACMFLAGKVEETPRPLKDVVLVSYKIIHKKDPCASNRIKQKEEYEKQKEIILLGETVVLTTLDFDLNVQHPYKPLVEAIKKLNVEQNALAQVAWRFVNDGMRTSLCLQYKPHHVAAGAIFLAAKFLKVKLPSDGGMVWWQDYDINPRQLEDISTQMMELYEQKRPAPSGRANEDGEADGGIDQHVAASPAISEGSVSVSGPSRDAGIDSMRTGEVPTNEEMGDSSAGHNVSQNTQKRKSSSDSIDVVCDHELVEEEKSCLYEEVEQVSGGQQNIEEASRWSELTSSRDAASDNKSNISERKELMDENLLKSNCYCHNFTHGENTEGSCLSDAIAKIDRDEVSVASPKRQKLSFKDTGDEDVAAKGDMLQKNNVIKDTLDGIEV